MHGIDTLSNLAGLILGRVSVEENQLLPRCKKHLPRLKNLHTKGPPPSYD